ncbi:MAG: thermonuclease family protein [Patescibacteria group bacterium]|nr:thermonuclease family protein [Patescibacteria group bacterium]
MKKPYTRKTILGVIAFLVASGGYGGYQVVRDYQKYGADFETRPHNVVRVVDGDTIEIENEIKVRLLGINAPERGECYFEESKKEMEALVEGRDVTLLKDITGKDRYGRLLRYVVRSEADPEADNLIVNGEMLYRGAAFTEAIAPDTAHRDLFATAQRKAKEAGRGLWSACEYKSEDEDLREEDSVAPSPQCTIKGNISEKGYGRNYFLEGCPNYSRIKVDTRKGEAWFCSERAAQKAGFTKSASCANTF